MACRSGINAERILEEIWLGQVPKYVESDTLQAGERPLVIDASEKLLRNISWYDGILSKEKRRKRSARNGLDPRAGCKKCTRRDESRRRTGPSSRNRKQFSLRQRSNGTRDRWKSVKQLRSLTEILDGSLVGFGLTAVCRRSGTGSPGKAATATLEKNTRHRTRFVTGRGSGPKVGIVPRGAGSSSVDSARRNSSSRGGFPSVVDEQMQVKLICVENRIWLELNPGYFL